jgi:hypothetical protein
LPVPYTIDIKYKMSLFLFFNGAKKSHHSSFSFFYLFCMESLWYWIKNDFRKWIWFNNHLKEEKKYSIINNNFFN